MNVICDIAAGLFAFLIENSTGVIKCKPKTNEETSLLQVPEDLELQDLADFANFDADDTIFREFDPPSNEEEDPKAWKKNRVPITTTIWESFKTVFMIQTVCGMTLGMLTIFLAFLDLNSGDLCYSMTHGRWYEMPHMVQAVRVTAQSIEGFSLQLWSYFLLSMVFPWSLMKELNLLTINILCAFLDICYRLFFQVYGIYSVHWKMYPLNALFASITTLNAFIIARHLVKHKGWIKVVRLTFRLSAQFVLGMIVVALVLYELVPWLNKQDGYTKVVVTAFSPLVTLIPKAIARIGAQKIDVIHPGTVHVFVAMLYGSTAIGFRILQSELGLKMYMALGVIHGVFDLLERLTITMRDYIWEFLIYEKLLMKPASVPKYRSPRSRRFMADLSIQIMSQEATALIFALGYIQLYLIYSDDRPKGQHFKLAGNFFIRASIGLFIDLVFATLSVAIQTHHMNFAIMKVWKKKWKHHVMVNAVIAALSTIYFSEHLLDVMRYKYNGLHDKRNCTLPFT